MRTYYKGTLAGLQTASLITSLFYRRVIELGISADDWTSGKLDTSTLSKAVFQPKLVKRDIQDIIPEGNKLWDSSHPNSTGIGRNWDEWWKGGRGPLYGWFYQLIRTGADKKKTRYVNSLARWPGEVNETGWKPPITLSESLFSQDHWRVNRDGSPRVRIPDEFRNRIISRVQFCPACSSPIGHIASDGTRKAHLDHMMARSLSVNPRDWDRPENLGPMCDKCNIERGTEHWSIFVYRKQNEFFSKLAQNDPEAIRRVQLRAASSPKNGYLFNE